jgi:hypothetical protein
MTAKTLTGLLALRVVWRAAVQPENPRHAESNYGQRGWHKIK